MPQLKHAVLVVVGYNFESYGLLFWAELCFGAATHKTS